MTVKRALQQAAGTNCICNVHTTNEPRSNIHANVLKSMCPTTNTHDQIYNNMHANGSQDANAEITFVEDHGNHTYTHTYAAAHAKQHTRAPQCRGNANKPSIYIGNNK